MAGWRANDEFEEIGNDEINVCFGHYQYSFPNGLTKTTNSSLKISEAQSQNQAQPFSNTRAYATPRYRDRTANISGMLILDATLAKRHLLKKCAQVRGDNYMLLAMAYTYK